MTDGGGLQKRRTHTRREEEGKGGKEGHNNIEETEWVGIERGDSHIQSVAASSEQEKLNIKPKQLIQCALTYHFIFS